MDQIQELQAAVGVLLRNRDHQAQVGFDQLSFRRIGLALTLPNRRVGVANPIEVHLRLIVKALQSSFGIHSLRIKLAEALEAQARVASHLGELFVVRLDQLVTLTQGFQIRSESFLQAFAHALTQHRHAIHQVLKLDDDAIDCLAVKVDRFKVHHQIGVQSQQRFFSFHLLRRLQRFVAQAGEHRRRFLLIELHVADQLMHLFDVLLFVVLSFFVFQTTEDGFHFDSAFVESLTQLDDLVRADRRKQNRLHDFALTLFDSTCDLNFAFACEQRHATHLAQVKSYGVVAAHVFIADVIIIVFVFFLFSA